MGLVEEPEAQGSWDMNPKTGILSRILRCKNTQTWACMEIWILQMILKWKWMHIYGWWIWIMVHGFGDVDFTEDPETKKYWDKNPRIWTLQRTLKNKNTATWIGIIQRILRHTDAETWIRRRGSCRNFWGKVDTEVWIRKYAYFKGSWDICGGFLVIRRYGFCRGLLKVKDTGDMNPKV